MSSANSLKIQVSGVSKGSSERVFLHHVTDRKQPDKIEVRCLSLAARMFKFEFVMMNFTNLIGKFDLIKNKTG